MRFTISDKHLIKWMWVKKIMLKNASSRCFWQKMKSWWGKDTDQNISAIYFKKVNLCSGVGIVWSTTTRTRVSDATAVTFSVKCFNLLKFYPLSGNIFRKWFASYFLFHHHHHHLIRKAKHNVKYIENCFLKMFLTEDEVLMG